MKTADWSLASPAFVGLACLQVALCVADPAPEATVPTASVEVERVMEVRLPANAVALNTQLEGSSVLKASASVFVSRESALAWKDVLLEGSRLLPGRALVPVGGGAQRLYFLSWENSGQCFLAVLERGEEMQKLTNLRTGADSSFASDTVGVVSLKEGIKPDKLLLTTDGGETWRTIEAVPQKGGISLLQWVSETRLLVGSGYGLVALLERDEEELTPVWKTDVKNHVAYLILDDDFVWVGQDTLSRIHLADGKIDTAVRFGRGLEVAAVCHGRLVVCYRDYAAEEAGGGFGSQYLIEVWDRPGSGQEYERVFTIPCPWITAALELDAPKCLLLAQDGRGFALDLARGELRPQELQVAMAPIVEPPPDPNLATPDELSQLFSLVRKLPEEESEAIMAEVARGTDLTPRGRVLRGIEKAQRSLDLKEAGEPTRVEEGGDNP